MRENVDPAFFVTHINHLEATAGVGPALRAMYEALDALLLAGHFDRCNAILRRVDPDLTPFSILLGYLTITLPWRANLPERGPCFQRISQAARRQFSARRVERFLQGLA